MATTSLYFDANAGAPLRPEALEAFCRAETDAPGNPSSLHRPGRRAQGVLEDARSRVARLCGVEERTVVFTSGATEAANLALFGLVRGRAQDCGRRLRLVSSAVEHPAVLGPLRLLQAAGHSLQLLPVDRHGRIAESALLHALDQPVDLVAVQWANNETGAIQPLSIVAEKIEALRRSGQESPLFFCDAVQGVGRLPWSPALASADALAISGHKFGAPKGIGVLIESGLAPFEALMGGGGQQRGRRPGTETPALAAALAAAWEATEAERRAAPTALAAARDAFWHRLCEGLLHAGLETPTPNHPLDPTKGLPNTLSLSFSGLDGRLLLPACDAAGIAVSSGSACSSGAATPSTVLLAAGLDEAAARASLRISLLSGCSPEQAHEGGGRLAEVVTRLYEVAKG